MGLVQDLINGYYDKNRKGLPNDTLGATSISGTIGVGNSKISEEDALSISAVLSAVDLISSTIARLPIHIYKEAEKGESIALVDDKRDFLLNNEPNNVLNGLSLKKRIVMDYLFYGNSYVVPERHRNDFLSLHHIPARQVHITKYAHKDKPYIVNAEIEVKGIDGSNGGIFSPDELIIVLKNSEDGLSSKGVLELNSELFELAMRQQKYSTSILQNGSLPLAVLEVPSKLTEKAINNIKQSWISNYTGGSNVGKTVVLEEGVQYKPVSLNPNELDLTATKKTVMSDIARIFGIPESMINADANKYNSNEQNNIYFLQYTLSPIISSIEVALDRALLLEDEKKQGYHFKFDTRDILATTESEKIDSTIKGLKGGLFGMNEARVRHGLREIDNDYMLLSLGNIFYDKDTKDMIIPNMGAIINPEDPDSMAQALGNATNVVKAGSETTNVDAKEEEPKQNMDNDESKDES